MEVPGHLQYLRVPALGQLVLEQLVDPRLLGPKIQVRLEYHLAGHGPLVVEVDRQHTIPLVGEGRREVRRERRLANATLLRR